MLARHKGYDSENRARATREHDEGRVLERDGRLPHRHGVVALRTKGSPRQQDVASPHERDRVDQRGSAAHWLRREGLRTAPAEACCAATKAIMSYPVRVTA